MQKIQKLGIIVVYFVDESDAPVLDMHLDMIHRNTTVDYTIYAAANRLTPKLQEQLEQDPHVKICSIPATDLRMSKEHGYYLEALADIATSDGVTHLCTFDVDSFPVRSDWAQVLAQHLSDTVQLAAVFREENGDSDLTHPSCMLFRKNFWIDYHPKFIPSWRECRCLSCLLFLLYHQDEADTGIGISYALYKHHLNWHKIKRSNVVNDHFMMGGIYGDVIFHLGASSRSKKHFRNDMNKINLSGLDRAAIRLGRYLPIPWLKRLITQRALANRDKALEPVHKKNQLIYDSIRAALLEDPEKYFRHLSGDN